MNLNLMKHEQSVNACGRLKQNGKEPPKHEADADQEQPP